MNWYRQHDDMLTLTLYVQPGAKVNAIVGFHGEALKIRLASPPIDGRANEALVKYLAILFEVPVRHVEIQLGEKSRRKVVAIRGSSVDPGLMVFNVI